MKVLDRLRKYVRRKLWDPEVELAEAPPWIWKFVCDFNALYPNATRAEWAKFAHLNSVKSWDDGFRSGWEAALYGRVPETLESVEPVPVLTGQYLDEPVPIQVPQQYEHAAFVDDMGRKVEP